MTELIGRTLRTLAIRPFRDGAIRFAAAVGERRAVCLDLHSARRAGHPDVVLLPAYLFGVERRLRGNELSHTLNVAPASIRHSEQELVQHAPVFAGDDLTFTAAIADFRVNPVNGMVSVVQESAVHRAGAVVLRMNQTVAVVTG